MSDETTVNQEELATDSVAEKQEELATDSVAEKQKEVSAEEATLILQKKYNENYAECSKVIEETLAKYGFVLAVDHVFTLKPKQ
jgi:hypothetical protein